MKKLLTLSIIILSVVAINIQAQELSNVTLAGKWRVLITKDEMTDKKEGLLILQAEGERDENTMLTVGAGLLGIVTDAPIRDCRAKLRWDDGPIQEVLLSVHDGPEATGDLSIAVIQLVGQVEILKRSKLLRVEVSAAGEKVVFKFNVQSAALAISKAEALVK